MTSHRYWWQQLWTKWDEFQQHEESMEKMHELRAQQQMTATNMTQSTPVHQPNAQWIGPSAPQFSPFMYHNISPINPNMSSPPNAGFPVDMMMASEAWYPADTDRGKAQSQPQNRSPPPGMIPLSEPQVTSTPTQPRYRGPVMSHQPSPPQGHYSPSPSINRVPEYVFNSARRPMRGPSPGHLPHFPRGQELARRPLPGRSYLASPLHQQAPTSSIRSRVMSALGMNPYSDTPPGLNNSGQNVCFLNSILQCLSHSPGLLQCLTLDSEQLRCSNPEAALVTSLAEMVQALTAKPGTSEVSVLDPIPVRRAASSLSGSMVTHPSQQQQQQDVAEFLMWLLQVLHNALNLYRRTTDHNGSVTGKNHMYIYYHPIHTCQINLQINKKNYK